MSLAVGVRIVGIDELTAQLEALGPRAMQVLAAALYQESEAIMTEAKEQVPVETGTLKNSGYVEPPVVDADGVSVTMGFGGAAEAYALIQHEDLSLNHPRGGNAKFLERPFLARSPQVLENVRAALGRALGV